MNARDPVLIPLSRSARLRSMLLSPGTEFLMEAHNGLSARIVREAGFKGIWASGLAISAQFGVRDNNEASWTQVVDDLEFMADASDLPILLDGDTGYGNFNNVRRLVRKLEQRGIAGVCIEDKVFPKTNSFIGGERQPLADVDEFCGKIKAGKSAQHDEHFSIVARVEALIAGWGMDEALRRAEAYRAAGADAILIHSKLSKPDEILAFAREWANRAPLVIVPTKYYSTPTDVFRKAGISVVIWANHLIRAATASMQAVAKEIHDTETLVNVEDRIATVNEIFRLQDADEYTQAEERYLSSSRATSAAIVLAASRGRSLEAVTTDRPKVMLPIAGKPLLRWLVDAFKKVGVNDITVVGGYRADAIASSTDAAHVKLVVNERYAETNELASLATAIDALKGDVVVSYGDLLFRSYILRDLVGSGAAFTVVVDSSLTGPPSGAGPNVTVRDYAYCSAADDRGLFGRQVRLERDLERRGARRTSAARPLDRPAVGARRRTCDAARAAGGAALARRLRRARHAGADQRAGRCRRDDRGPLRARPLARRQRPRRLPARRRLRARAGAARGEGRRRRAMIDARAFVDAARARGFERYAGVPCSFLTPFIDFVLQRRDARLRVGRERGRRGRDDRRRRARGPARRDDDAELRPRQRGEPADVADVDVPAAAAADRDVARRAGRPRRAAARADGADHAGDARHDGDRVGAVPDRERGDRAGARPRGRAHGRDRQALRAADAERAASRPTVRRRRPMRRRAGPSSRGSRRQAPRRLRGATRWPGSSPARRSIGRSSSRRPASAAVSSPRSTTGRTSCIWSDRWAARRRSRSASRGRGPTSTSSRSTATAPR